MFHLVGALMFTWTGVKLNPGGIFIAIGVTDTLYQALVNGYLVMTVSSPELRAQGEWMRSFLFKFRMYTVAFCTAHAIFFAAFGDSFNECGSLELRLFMIIYPLCLLLLFPKDFAQRTDMNANYVQKSEETTKLVD